MSSQHSLFDPQPKWQTDPLWFREEQWLGASGWRELNHIPQYARINVRTRGFVSNWRKVGVVQSISTLDPSVYALYERPVDANRGQYDYYVEDENGFRIELYRPRWQHQSTLNTPWFLPTGYVLRIPTKEALGQFVVWRYEDDVRYQYRVVNAF